MCINPLTIAILLLYKVAIVDGTTAAAAHDVTGNNFAPTGLRLRGANNENTNAHTPNNIIIDTQDVKWPQKSDETLRSLQSLQNDDDDDILILSQPLSFQIVMSFILAIIALAQLALLIIIIVHRSKRVLEFAQPHYICILIAAGVVVTAACYLFLYITTVGCIIREPLIFVSLSLMGATIAGRAWRISTLMSNPLMTAAGRRSNSNDNGSPARVERARQFVMMAISALSGCDYSVLSLRAIGGGSSAGRPLRVQINFIQMTKAIIILCIPQISLQVILMGVPGLRSTKTISYSENFGMSIIAQYECQCSAAGSWPIVSMCISVLFVIFPFGCAYLLNLRPNIELEKLPQIIDESRQLKWTFVSVARVLTMTVPVIGMTYYYPAPAIRAYASICALLGLTLSLTYSIAFVKLAALRSRNSSPIGISNFSTFQTNEGNKNVSGRDSAAYAVKMAEMYSKIGRTEETLSLIDETLEVWKGKGNSGGIFGNQDAREEVGCGYTKQDLNNLEPEELGMIIQLLVIKGDALMKLHGMNGFPLSAEMNINAMKIFENCPAATKMKDVSIMFPIYNRVGLQLKGGVVDQDDACSLEMDLAERFCHEARIQSYHLARALGGLAEWYGRIGATDKAFQCFHTMSSIYMPKEHPPLIYKAYSVNRCAITFAVSALWYLQTGEVTKAIERCDQVTKEILPSYDTKDMIGLYHIFWPIIRVLKWSGEVDKARDFYNKWAPEGIESHFAVGSLHKPMCLLLTICDGSSAEYDAEDLAADIPMILSFDAPDMTDLNFITDGWSVKSMAAELCLHLARRLQPGDVTRRSLIVRGIQMSTLANQRNTSSGGLIKHIMAYEAHKGIDDRLLALRIEDNAVNGKIIYDGSERICRKMSAKELSVEGSSAGMRHDVSFNFADRFIVKGSSKSNTSKSIAKSVSGGKSSTSSVPGILKKRPKESNGSTSRSPFPSRKSSSKNSQHSQHSRKPSRCEIIIESEGMKNGNEEWGEIKEPLPQENILLNKLDK